LTGSVEPSSSRSQVSPQVFFTGLKQLADIFGHLGARLFATCCDICRWVVGVKADVAISSKTTDGGSFGRLRAAPSMNLIANRNVK
jgi:hypothetical protein